MSSSWTPEALAFLQWGIRNDRYIMNPINILREGIPKSPNYRIGDLRPLQAPELPDTIGPSCRGIA